MILNNSPDMWLDAPIPDDAKLSWSGLDFGIADEIGYRSSRKGPVDHHHIRHAHDRGDRRDVAPELEMQLVVERRVDRLRRRYHQDGVSVGCRINDCLHADIACRAGPVLDDKRLPKPLRQPCPTARAMMSLGPAGANGTMIRTGRDG